MSRDLHKGHGIVARPQISVVIPAYNAQRTILRALRSVLAQTLEPLEIIVVDDGSTDNTASVVEEFSRGLKADFLKLVKSEPNRGVYYARNVGWDMASGEFLAFLDADDAWHPRKLEIQGNYMVQHDELALTAHRGACLLEGDDPPIIPERWSVTPIAGWRLMSSSCHLWLISIMMRRQISYRFDSCKRCLGDRLLWLQLVLAGHKAARLELPLAYTYKALYGEGGLSSHLWESEKSELENFSQLRCMGLLNRRQEIAFKSWSLLKYMRRVWICRRR